MDNKEIRDAIYRNVEERLRFEREHPDEARAQMDELRHGAAMHLFSLGQRQALTVQLYERRGLRFVG